VKGHLIDPGPVAIISAGEEVLDKARAVGQRIKHRVRAVLGEYDLPPHPPPVAGGIAPASGAETGPGRRPTEAGEGRFPDPRLSLRGPRPA
jgi:hypothetical protein